MKQLLFSPPTIPSRDTRNLFFSKIDTKSPRTWYMTLYYWKRWKIFGSYCGATKFFCHRCQFMRWNLFFFEKNWFFGLIQQITQASSDFLAALTRKKPSQKNYLSWETGKFCKILYATKHFLNDFGWIILNFACLNFVCCCDVFQVFFKEFHKNRRGFVVCFQNLADEKWMKFCKFHDAA